MSSSARRIIKTCGYYLILVLFICTLMKIVFQIPIRGFLNTFSAPLFYFEDAYGSLIPTQNYIAGGTMTYYPNLSAPFEWHATGSTISWFYHLLFYIGSLFSNQTGLIVNVLYLASYPLIGITAAFSLRKLGVSPILSFAGGVLYTFLPFHYLRNIKHLLLALYYPVPFVCLISIWFLNGEINRTSDLRIGQKRDAKAFFNRKMLFALFTGFFVAFGEMYTAYFMMICIAFSAVYEAITDNDKVAFWQGVAIIGAVGAGLAIQLLPAVFGGNSVLSNNVVTSRNSGESEVYGLKIIQMILPVSNHRFFPFAKLTDIYNTYAPLVTENKMATLGSFTTVGFLLSLFYAFFDNRPGSKHRLETQIGRMNIFTVLLATIGGFNVLIALCVTTVIRCYNRLSIYIAFLSLVVLLLSLQKCFNSLNAWVNRRIRDSRKIIWMKGFPLMMCVVAIGISVLGVYDQVPENASMMQPGGYLDTTVAEWKSDDDFVKQIEAAVPVGSMIFELPAVSVGGGLTINQFFTYDIYKPFLHSTTLKWSASLGVGDKSDQWNSYQGSLSVKEMIDNISLVGFSGIYIDSYGYTKEDFQALIQNIEAVAQTEPISSMNGRLYFYRIDHYAASQRSQYSDAEYEGRRRAILDTY